MTYSENSSILMPVFLINMQMQRHPPTAPHAQSAGHGKSRDGSAHAKSSIWSHIKLSFREKFLVFLLVFSTALAPSAANLNKQEVTQVTKAAELQPWERASDNFPGSAFYFLDPNFATPENYDTTLTGDEQTNDELTGDTTNMAVGSVIPARALTFRGSASDNSRALQCLTTAIYYEAGLEPDAGQRAVAQVILNRVRHPSYPSTICGVIYQGSERRTGCQFTFSCDGSMARQPSRVHWKRARNVASDILAGNRFAPAGHATHYHTTEVSPYWAPSLHFLGTIGAHRFYRWKGNAGKPAAFHQSYRGREPLPQPKPKAYTDKPALDPISLAKAFEDGRRKAEVAEQAKAEAIARQTARLHGLSQKPTSNTGAAVTQYQAPDYSAAARKRGGEKAFAAPKAPDVSQIKPAYQNSGTWKKRPGS